MPPGLRSASTPNHASKPIRWLRRAPGRSLEPTGAHYAFLISIQRPPSPQRCHSNYLNRRFGFLDPNQPIITGKLRQIFIATTAERDVEIGVADVPLSS